MGTSSRPINRIAAASPNSTITKVATAPVVRFTFVKFGPVNAWVEFPGAFRAKADWGMVRSNNSVAMQLRAIRGIPENCCFGSALRVGVLSEFTS